VWYSSACLLSPAYSQPYLLQHATDHRHLIEALQLLEVPAELLDELLAVQLKS
jgi:hypothetical protein